MAMTISRAPTKILFPNRNPACSPSYDQRGSKIYTVAYSTGYLSLLDWLPVLNEQKWLNENTAISLLEAIDCSRRTFEDDIYTPSGEKVEQTHDLGDVEDIFVEMGCLHPGTLRGVDRGGLSRVEWVWADAEGREVPLGTEKYFQGNNGRRFIDDLNRGYVLLDGADIGTTTG